MMALSNLTEKNLKDYTVYMFKGDAYTQFKVESKNVGESTLEFFVDNKTKHLYKLSILFPKANYFSEDITDESEEQPFIVLIYEPLTSLKNASKLFDTKNVLIPDEKGRFSLAPSYSNFKLYDSRYEPTKK